MPPHLPAMLDTNVYIQRLRRRLPAGLLAFVEDRPVYLIPREDGTLTIGATTREDSRDQPQVQGIHQ